MIKVLVKKLTPSVKLPSYKTNGASGMDLMAYIDKSIELRPGESCLVPTGISVAIPGDTEVQIVTGEDYHPEFSIMTVRPLATHPGVDAWFVQLQLNDTKIRGKGRLSTNLGVGYRKLSESKNSFTGANLFIDYDAEGNARSSVGLELRSSAFEIIANYYQALMFLL